VLKIVLGAREHFDKLSASQGTGNREQGRVSRVGWELFFLGIKLKCKVFEFPPRKSLHFFYMKTAQTLYL
jgi:hypothetical protein